MKKAAAFVLASVIGAGGVIGTTQAFADSSTDTAPTKKIEIKTSHKQDRVKLVQQFSDELHQSNKLKKERLALQSSIVSKNDRLIDLMPKAKEARVKNAWKDAKETKKELKDVNKEVRTLKKQLREGHKAIKQAAKNGDEKKVQDQFTKVLKQQNSLNQKLQEKKKLLDDVVTKLNQ